VGASTIPAAFLIPDLLGQFSVAWPGVRLELLQGDTREILRLLQSDTIELAVVGGQFDAGAVAYEELGSEQIKLIALPEQVTSPEISVQQLRALPLVLREPGSGTRLAVDSVLHQAGVDPRKVRVVAQLGSSEAVRRAVLSGAGYAFLSTLAVRHELADGTLTAVEIAGIEIRRSFYLAWRKGKSLSPAAEAFMATMRKLPSSLLAHEPV
jgi:DNA-binding transcriptional LysR family regulator